MADLTPAQFSEYFQTVHGAEPFPWQQRLLEAVTRDGRWPLLLDLPTGCGKTAAIDVAVFHLALDAALPPSERRAPRRIVMVVDRRTVVDQAFRRAQTIQRSLSGATQGVLARVRDRLGSLCDAEPLACVQLRGGMPRDDGWARRPDQPVVAVSTVDQVGSRLLFRGYGVSDAMRPIHAGLLGHDAIFLLDEVHLSQSFLETLESIRRYRQRSSDALPDRWQVVAMSATPGKADVAFGLEDDDRKDKRLAARLQASKPIERELVKETRFTETISARVTALATSGRCVGVVVNRVATALEVYRSVRDACEDALVFLVTGRMRPLDRKDLEDRLCPLVCSGRERKPDAPPVVVVATQCIEAGADFDFDALVTECASLDALRQRFGRLNRLGVQASSPGVVVTTSSAIGKDADDFVYGNALATTWRWIEEAPRDFGIDAMKNAMPIGGDLAAMLPPSSRAPVMLPAHLDAWVQTAPIPRPDPDVSLWLHGVGRERDADVQIVWRADICQELMELAEQGQEEATQSILARVEVCAPSGLEAVAVPIASARAWLEGATPPDVADVEGVASAGDLPGAGDSSRRTALLWCGDQSRLVRAGELRPGMTLVVPSTYGGLTSGTWDPSSAEPVGDLGDRARWQQTHRATLRLHPALLQSSWNQPHLSVEEDLEDDERERVDEWFRSMASMEVPTWMREVLDSMTIATKKRRRRLAIVHLDAVRNPDGREIEPGYLGLVLRGNAADMSTEDDASSLTGVEVTLREHMSGVAAWAVKFGTECGLPSKLIGDLEIAGRWHDAGKVDPRFQRMLRAGSALADIESEPLAKSASVSADRAARHRARELSGYPKGARHELASVCLMREAPELLQDAVDRELVLHLVASHHGWCRPFAPVIEDPEPVKLTLQVNDLSVQVDSNHGLAAVDSGIADHFWVLVRRYGWYGLAWLEAILRLADHRRSEWEQSRGNEGGDR